MSASIIGVWVGVEVGLRAQKAGVGVMVSVVDEGFIANKG